MRFTDHTINLVNGISLCNSIFGKGGVTHHKEIKAFFRAVNYTIPAPPANTLPN